MHAGQGSISVVLVDDQMFRDAVAHAVADDTEIDLVGMAGTLAGARQLAADLQPMVTVLAHWLPDGDGVTGARRVLRVAPATKVLLLADAEGSVLADAIDAGCAGFLTKDRGLGELVSAVRALAAGDAYVPPDLLTALIAERGDPRLAPGRDVTHRELEVLRLAADGLTSQAIADELGVTLNTVRNHVQAAITKLGAHSKLEAVVIAIRERLIDIHDG